MKRKFDKYKVMSRSRRKSPCFHIGCPKEKRTANRLVRRYKGELSNGNFYKKLYESYSIIDWIMFDERQVRKNKEFRRIAKIIRRVWQGKESPHKYNFQKLLEILKDTEDSFWYTNKK